MNEVEVGQLMIIRSYNRMNRSMPVQAVVEKINPAGSFKLVGLDGLFLPDKYQNVARKRGDKNTVVVAHTETRWAEEVTQGEKVIASEARQIEHREKERKCAELREAKRMKECKEAVGEIEFLVRKRMSNGSRFYVVVCPTRQAGTTYVSIKCISRERQVRVGVGEWEDAMTVSSSATWTSDRNDSFTSCSSNSTYKTDTDAIWSFIEHAYYD